MMSDFGSRPNDVIELRSISHKVWMKSWSYITFWSDFRYHLYINYQKNVLSPSSNTFTLVSNTLLINLNWVDRCLLTRDNAQLGKHKEMNKVKTHLANQNVFSSSLFKLYRFCRFQLLLDNAHFFVLPKVNFVFSGPHLLGFKVCELKF